MYPKPKVFVYGTLKRGFSNHRLLEGARFVGCARTAQPYALYESDYPLVYRKERVSTIGGEVYEMDPDQLMHLDRLEQHPDYYCRDQVDVVLEGGARESVWLYFFPVPQGTLIESGDWGLPQAV